MDRDGTINRKNGLVSQEDQFVLEECAVEAIRTINKSGYLAIVITNQPVVARGLCEIEDVERIHNKMKTLLDARAYSSMRCASARIIQIRDIRKKTLNTRYRVIAANQILA